MGSYRLVDDQDVVVTTFEATDDEIATRHGREASRRRVAPSRVFAVQRAVDGTWRDVAAWVPRPLGRQSWAAEAGEA